MRIQLMMLLAVAVLAASPVFACSAEYSAEQCRQADDQNDGSTGDGTAGGGTKSCPYYMCGNAIAGHQEAWDWCSDTQSWTNCTIEYCTYQSCVGYNCYPSWKICETCSSRTGNKATLNQCPRQ